MVTCQYLDRVPIWLGLGNQTSQYPIPFAFFLFSPEKCSLLRSWLTWGDLSFCVISACPSHFVGGGRKGDSDKLYLWRGNGQKFSERQKHDRIFILAMTFCPYTHEIRCLTKVVVTNWTNLDLTFDTLWNTLSPYRPSVPLRRTMGLFFKSARQVILAPNLQAMSCSIGSHAIFW